MFTVTRGKALLTTTTGALPRPTWFRENLRGLPLSHGLAHLAYREQHFDCLACHVASQHKAGIDIMVDGDTRLDDDVAGRSWVSYATERIEGIGPPRVEVQPAAFTAEKGPGDIMWEVLETRMTPTIDGKIGATHLQLDRAYKAIAGMTSKPVKIGSVSAQVLARMVNNKHYKDRLELLTDLSVALNREYHALADAGAPLLQVEEPAIHQGANDPSAGIDLKEWVKAFNLEVGGLREKCEVWCHTCWGSPAAQRVFSAHQSYKKALPYLDQLDVDVITVEGASNGGVDLEYYGSMISKNKKIALGVISHRTLQIETPEEVASLIRRALKYIEPERLLLSSDCGFGRQSMSRMHAFYKMVALARGANIVRGELGLPVADIPAESRRLSMVSLVG